MPLTTAQCCFAAVLALTGLMRLVELVVSRRRMAARPDAVVAEPALFPAMALLHTALVTLPLAEVWLLNRPFQPVVCAVASLILALATALRAWTLRSIGPAWNVRVVQPQNDAVSTKGPYAFIRHPNYLVVILEIAALPLLHSAWLSAITLSLLNAAVLARRIPTEERSLLALPAWRAAFKGKKRFIPGLF